MAIKRGIADAARRMYTERNLLKYDGRSRDIRFADVIELTHPKPTGPRQSALFRFALDRRHDHGKDLREYGQDDRGHSILSTLRNDAALLAMPTESRREHLRANPTCLEDAGWTWERLSGWLPGGMDNEAWQSIIPSMGVMALVRNLRNFDQASIGENAIDSVIARITDPDEVAKARLFPYQVWSAYRNAPSDNWKRALGKTLDLTTANIPSELDGTLVVIDCSGSMAGTVSDRSALSRWEVAAVMGAASYRGTQNSDVVVYGNSNMMLPLPKGTSALQVVDRVRRVVDTGEVGHSTNGHTAIAAHFDSHRHKRVVVFTDDQQQDSGRVRLDHVPLIYTFDLAGYAASSLEAGTNRRHTLGGFSDSTFRLMKVLETGKSAGWPF
jgi:hypothetical protein